jgi:hypothetical protein
MDGRIISYFGMRNTYGNGLMTFSEMDYDSGRW